MRLTVGPLPPAVYWRRRALVLGGALLVLFLVAQACMAVSAAPEDGAATESTSSPTSSPTSPPAAASPEPDDEPDGVSDPEGTPGPGSAAADSGAGAPDPDAPELCTDDEIRVTAQASQQELAVGETVEFTIQIEHDGDGTCRRDVGGDQRELYLVRGTGADHVWSSRDCDPPTGSRVLDLAPGTAREHHIAFLGRGSESCDGPSATGAELDPGDYSLYARLGSALSEPVGITLTP